MVQIGGRGIRAGFDDEPGTGRQAAFNEAKYYRAEIAARPVTPVLRHLDVAGLGRYRHHAVGRAEIDADTHIKILWHNVRPADTGGRIFCLEGEASQTLR